jgi:hypothetical protein
MLNFLPATLRSRIEPWLTWAATPPMRENLIEALHILDTHDDSTVTLNDLGARRALRTHAAALSGRRVRSVFDDLSPGALKAETKQEREDHIKRDLMALTPSELADVIAELPVFLASRKKPRVLQILGEKEVATLATGILNDFLTSLRSAPHIAPQIMEGILAGMGTQVESQQGRGARGK